MLQATIESAFRCNVSRFCWCTASSPDHGRANLPHLIESPRQNVDESVPLAFFSEYLLFLLSLLKELQLRNNPCDLPLVHYVHLGDIKHQEQEVKLAHGCILQYYERCDVLDDTRCDLLVIEVNGRVPEVLQLVLPSLDVF